LRQNTAARISRARAFVRCRPDIVLILSLALAALIGCLIARAFSQRHALAPLRETRSAASDAAGVAVIVPARDESANIGTCLKSLVAQDYPHLAIVVVDDHSSDDTAAIVRRFAAADRRVVLLHSSPLPPNWTGKVNACVTGARAVAEAARWLCFLDADMRAEPSLIASAVAAAEGDKIDLLTLAPRQELKSFAERLILPCGLYLLSFSQNLAKIQAPESDDAAATGQFMLIRRDAYEDVGGHAAVSRSIVEDVDLARLMKRRGHRVLMQDGRALLSTRMYTGWATLWPGIAKNLVDMLGGPAATLATAAAGVTLAWATVLVPAIDATGCIAGTPGACFAAIPAFLGAGAAFGLHIAGAAFFRIPLYYGLLFPLGYTAGAMIALDSLRWRLSGRVRWKGRVYR
jgi:chlorobactene glucosyltransferase